MLDIPASWACSVASAPDPQLRTNKCCVTATVLDEPVDTPGKKAQSACGSLAVFTVARHGTESQALEEREIEMFRTWFESGGD